MLVGKIIAIVILVGAAFVWFRGWAFLLIGILLLLWIIRLAADIFWWAKDNGKI